MNINKNYNFKKRHLIETNMITELVSVVINEKLIN